MKLDFVSGSTTIILASSTLILDIPGSPYRVRSSEENGLPDPLAPSLLVNIVTLDFADRAFYDLKNTALETNMGGIMGLKYEYEYEGLPKIAIVAHTDEPLHYFKPKLLSDTELEYFFPDGERRVYRIPE